MFDKLCDNINVLMTTRNVSADELGRRTAIPASTIKRIRNRKNPNPTLATLIPIARYFAVTVSQLIGDEPLPATTLPAVRPVRFVPVLAWDDIMHVTANQVERATLQLVHAYGDDVFAVVVTEEDWGHFVKGTVLVVDPSVTPQHRDYVLVHRAGQTLPTVRQLLQDDNTAYLKPLVSGYHISALSADHQVKGVVVEYQKRLKDELHA